MERTAAATGFEGDDGDRGGHQNERERGRGRATVGGFVLHEDGRGEGLEAEERDGSEVGEGVEGRQERTGGDCRTQRGDGHRGEGAQRSTAETAADLFERGIEAAKRRHGWEQHVGVGEEREGEQGSRKAVQIGDFGHAERAFEGFLHEAARAEGGAGYQRVDEAGHYEGKGHDDRPPAAAREVGDAGDRVDDRLVQRCGYRGDDADVRNERRVGRVDDAERRFAARHERERGPHVGRRREALSHLPPEAQRLQRLARVDAGRHVVGVAHRQPPVREQRTKIELLG